MSYDLPNPFLFLSVGGNAAPGLSASQHAERLPSSDAAGAGAAPAYPCCHDCGVRDPCDDHCPNAITKEVMPHTVRTDRSDARHDNAQPPSHEVGADRFQLDEAALMSEIEPVPAFISRRTTAEEIEELLELARAEEWPAPPRRMVG